MKILSLLTAVVIVMAPLIVEAKEKQKPFGVMVINRTGAAVWSFRSSNKHNESWGRDRLAKDDVIMPGYQTWFDLRDGTGECLFDLRAEFSDGEVAESFDIDLCTNHEWTLSEKR
jgi:hypothetical protein